MKKLLFLFTMLVFVMACGDDNDNDNSDSTPGVEPESPEDNLPEASKTFVGLWINQGNKGGNFLFFGDGVCWMMLLDTYGTHNYYHTDGYWTYDASTKILATTTNQWQWQVTLSNTEAWTGLSLGSGTAQTFKKEKDQLEFMKVILYNSFWEETSDSTLTVLSYDIFHSHSKEKYTSNFSGFSIGNSLDAAINVGTAQYIEILEDDNTEDYTFKYNLREKNYLGEFGNRLEGYYKKYSTPIVGSGTVSLKNPTSSTKCNLVFTGTIDKILIRKKNN
ncbi:MAG: hypothetical protein ACLTSL_07925 [Odoribacter splanchnicus]